MKLVIDQEADIRNISRETEIYCDFCREKTECFHGQLGRICYSCVKELAKHVK